MAEQAQESGADSISAKTIIKLVAMLLLLGGIATFILQNGNDVEVQFLNFSGDAPLYAVIIVSMLLGILGFGVVGLIWRRARSEE